MGDEALRDAYYLTTAIRTERLEITAYEGLLRTAETAGLGAAVTDPLVANLGQEEKTLRKLEGLAGESDLESLWRSVAGVLGRDG